jgi:hypothetical protein
VCLDLGRQCSSDCERGLRIFLGRDPRQETSPLITETPNDFEIRLTGSLVSEGADGTCREWIPRTLVFKHSRTITLGPISRGHATRVLCTAKSDQYESI